MKRITSSLLLASLLMFSWPALASSYFDTTRTREAHKYGLAFQFGSTGIGLQLACQLPPQTRLTARIGVNYLAYKRAIGLTTSEDGKLIIQPDFMMSFGLASLKWHPFQRSSFFMTAGAGYAWHPYLGLSIRAEDKVTFGGLEMTPENVGIIDSKFRWSNLVSYAGVGFGRSIPHQRVGFGIELGCYYLSAPKVDLQYEGFLETTTIQEQIPLIQRNLSGYRYLPSLQFSVTYAIH